MTIIVNTNTRLNDTGASRTGNYVATTARNELIRRNTIHAMLVSDVGRSGDGSNGDGEGAMPFESIRHSRDNAR